MFYENQTKENRESYKSMLKLLGSLSKIFSESDKPYLYYRSHENVFCKYFEAANLAREDCSADAKKDKIGIGLKTWIDGDNQKVAEFGKARKEYEKLSGIDLAIKIAELRNKRIKATMAIHGLDKMIYHIVKRFPQAMKIYEAAFDLIDIQNIKLLDNSRASKSTFFTDGKHKYHFYLEKCALFMEFENMLCLDEFNVEILDDPYEVLSKLIPQNIDLSKISQNKIPELIDKENKLCLRLYTVKRGKNGEKVVEEKSGLNQWNGTRKDKNGIMHPRDVDELYIPYPKEDRDRKDFFPNRNEDFDLHLPNGKTIKAKVCQSDGKAIMSNPNKTLGHWLLRDVLGLKIGELVTYDFLQAIDIDSVIFTKNSNYDYSIDFCSAGTYEKFYDDENKFEKSEEIND